MASNNFIRRNRPLNQASNQVDKIDTQRSDLIKQNQKLTTNASYSSRNSLRTAPSFSSNDQSPTSPYKMPEMENSRLVNVTFERGIEETSKYILMTPGVFLRTSGENLYCILCGKRNNMATEDACELHLGHESHMHSYYLLKTALCDIPSEVDSFQMSVTKELLTRWYNSQILDRQQLDLRESIVSHFNALLATLDPQCRTVLVGSFATSTSLRTSDINLELIHQNSKLFESDSRAKNSIHHKLFDDNACLGRQINYHTLHYDLIPNAFYSLYNIKTAIENRIGLPYANLFKVVSDMNDINGKVPKLVLQHLPSGIILQIICYAESSHKLSSLLSTYMKLDERACILSILVKYWAKLCKIDDTERGALPPDAYVILVIYFLQRTSPPILPCLHEIISKGAKTAATSDNHCNDIFKKQFEKLNIGSNVTSEHDDQTDDTANESRLKSSNENNSTNNGEAVEDEEDEDDVHIDSQHFDVRNLSWASANATPVQKLFVDFLKFMIIEFSNVSTVISIRTLREVPLASKKWNSQVKSIENPVRPKSNISRCVGSQRIFDFMRGCFRRAFQYINFLPSDNRLRSRIKKQDQMEPNDCVKFFCHKDRLDNYFDTKRKMLRSKSNYNTVKEMIDNGLFAKDIELINSLFANYHNMSDSSLVARVADLYELDYFVAKDVASVTFCRLCKQTGHLKKSCPKGKREYLSHESANYNFNLDLDPRSNLDYILLQFYQRDRIDTSLSMKHQRVLDELTELINSSGIGITCRLQLFGSTVNNLGSYDSDLDICMTLEGNPTGRDIDFVEVMRKVYQVLIKDLKIDYVEPIISTRVPIIKFQYGKFDVDLSMYNLCATHNSRLLGAYSSLDPRVAQLFYVVKKYAKECLIADASRGSLSSYAWSILVIHYLQRTSPPILPVLQEVPPGREKPIFGVNGWNVWFDEQTKSFPCKNTMTLTQLYKGFLLYYGLFDFNLEVISIRKLEPITRFQKNWNNCMMAIEDPFELTYNLASRLDDLMAIYIMKYIVHIQNQCIKNGPNKKNSDLQENRLFNGRNIMGKEPPFRGCRQCHRVGHRFKDCPEKRRDRNLPFPDRPSVPAPRR